jgi:hypothetical protein
MDWTVTITGSGENPPDQAGLRAELEAAGHRILDVVVHDGHHLPPVPPPPGGRGYDPAAEAARVAAAQAPAPQDPPPAAAQAAAGRQEPTGAEPGARPAAGSA